MDAKRFHGWLLVVIWLTLGSGLAWGQEKQVSPFQENLAWQIALERECFSPGLVDGKVGPKTRLATSFFQKARGLPVTGVLDEITREALALTTDAVLTEYPVQQSDLEDIVPFTDDWLAKSQQKVMGYYSVLDGLAEHFHTSKAVLQMLNPGVEWDKLQPGMKVLGPAIPPTLPSPKASALQVDLGRKLIMGVDMTGKVLGLFHCSIAAKVEKRPSGETVVKTIAPNPDYTWDPQYWPEVKGIDRKLMISPGPRNPVGVCWIGLDLPGYGMHGTPQPENIGKTGSHGCFRMTNWDARRLAKMISPGAKVAFIAASEPTTRKSR